MEKIRELKKIKELLDEGIISKVEFQNLKKNIIGKSVSNITDDNSVTSENNSKHEIEKSDSLTHLNPSDSIDKGSKIWFSNKVFFESKNIRFTR